VPAGTADSDFLERNHRSLAQPGDDGRLSTTAKILGEIEQLIRDARGVLTEAAKNTDLDQDNIGTAFLVIGEELFHRLKVIETQVETLRSYVEIGDYNGSPDAFERTLLISIKPGKTANCEHVAYEIITPSALRLSSRETEVGRLISGGFTNQQIARRLQISHKTVETYIARIFKKLDVLSRAEVARIFGSHKLV
jgi:DNA-binding CsgD family transcriptional regulator